MTRLKYYISLIAILWIVSGCQENFLDQVPDDRLTVDQVFERRDLSEQYLANIYSYIRDESFRSTGVPWDPLSDDLDVTYDRAGYNSYQMNLGKWSPSDYYYDFWRHYYNGIRSATYFINNIDANQEILETPNGFDLIKQYKAEARFLRAFFYFNLLRQYGPVILLGEEEIPVDKPFEELQIPRSAYDECVDYIASELDKAAENLPLHFTEQQTQDYGRATKTMSLAVKSRMLLYAASPLFNGNKDYSNFKNPDGQELINTQYDQEKWKRAADAAKDIIDEGIFSLYKENDDLGNFDPYLSCRNVLLVPWNQEVIFARPGNEINRWERTCTPTIGGGWPGVGVTQQLVDAFYMENGESPITGYDGDGSPIINPDSEYSETGFSTADTKYTKAGTYNMYVNREPRFYVNVSFTGSLWLNTSEGEKVIETFYSGESGKGAGSDNYSRTGYIARKNVSPDANPRINKFAPRPLLLYRYAEVLLNYVEALNEYNPGNADILLYLNMIRERAGIADVPAGLNQDAMRDVIHQERRVEMALENLRFSDTRRWKIAEETDGGPFYGMNVDVNPPGFYQRTVFETRVFQKKYNLFPIGQHEIDRNVNLVQNPGW